MNRAVVKPENMAPSPDGVRLIKFKHQLLKEPVEGLAGVEAVVDCEVEGPVTANGCDDVELGRSERVGQVLLLIAEGPPLLSEVGLVKGGLVDAHDHLALMKELDVSSSRHLSLENGHGRVGIRVEVVKLLELHAQLFLDVHVDHMQRAKTSSLLLYLLLELFAGDACLPALDNVPDDALGFRTDDLVLFPRS